MGFSRRDYWSGYSLHTSHPLLPSPCVHKSVLYVCFSIPALQIVLQYHLICKVESQRKLAVGLRELKQGLCINIVGWGGRRDGDSKGRGPMHIYG